MKQCTPKMHVGVYGILVKNNSILLITKSRGPYAGLLDLPGGRLEHGEKPEEALHREIAEETGVIIQDGELVDVVINYVTYDSFCFHHVGLLYNIPTFDDRQLNLNVQFEDVSGCNWYALSDAKDDQISFLVKEALTYAKL